MSTRCCWTRPAPSPWATARPPQFLPLEGVSEQELAEAAFLASQADETPEGRSIVALAQSKYGVVDVQTKGTFVPFTAQTRLSGIDSLNGSIRKGAVDAVLQWSGLSLSGAALTTIADRIAKTGGTPLAVVRDKRLLGVIHLKDIVKGGIRERFTALRQMGIRTVMITGDNPLTAAAIAAEAGVDDFLAQATPENKLALIREEQGKGKLVAMCGDGTNDAPALAQADVGVAMNTGTMAAREAGNMVDLDSDPTKLIEIVEIGKQLLMTRGALTTFSIANDVAKYFAIIPAMFLAFYPQLQALNVMGLHSPQSAILSAIIFNALIIVALIPLALKGVKYRPEGAGVVLRRNLLVYGLGGIVVPFIGIKAIDLIVTAFGWLKEAVMQHIRPAILMILVMTLVTGLFYPLAFTALAGAVFPHQAAGSLVTIDNKVIGSEVIGQQFASAKYFHGRPSAAGNGYDAANSGGSNYAPDRQEAEGPDRRRCRQAACRKSGHAGAGRPGDGFGQRAGPGHQPRPAPCSRCRASPRPAICPRNRSRPWWAALPKAGCSASWASRMSMC